jgi:hypothetical protein
MAAFALRRNTHFRRSRTTGSRILLALALPKPLARFLAALFCFPVAGVAKLLASFACLRAMISQRATML